MKKILSFLMLMIFLSVNLLLPFGELRAAEDQTLNGSVTAAAVWLESAQNEDGSWGTDDSLQFRTTSKVLENLLAYGLIKEAATTNAAIWLEDNPPQNNTDLIGLISIPGKTAQEKVIQLVNAQEEDGGWGTKAGSASDNMTTCLAAAFLLKNGYHMEEVVKAANYLLSNQNSDGSWSVVIGDNSGSFEITGMVRALLVQYQQQTRCNLSAVLGKAANWLLTGRYADGGWGSIDNTCMAYIGLEKDNYDLVSTIPDYLISLQKQDGSWNSDPYQTALVLGLLSEEKQEAIAGIAAVKFYIDGKKVGKPSFSAKKTIEIVPVYSGHNVQPYVTIITPDGLRIELVRSITGGFLWNTEMARQGDYQAEAVLKDKQGQVKAILTNSFYIQPILDIAECKLDITPRTSTVNKPVKPVITFEVKCSAANVNSPVTAACSVTDASGKEICSTTNSILLNTGDNSIPLGSFLPVATSVTEYTVKVVLSYQGRELDRLEDTFNVLAESNVPPEKPKVPGNFKAQPEDGTNVKLSWSQSEYASNYELEIDGVIVDNNDSTVYMHTGLKPDSTHKYRVRAVNSKGASEWSELKIFSFNHWYQGVNMEAAKSKTAAVSIGDKIYVIGGITTAGAISAEIEEFSIETGKWVTNSNMPGGARQGMAAATVNGKIYIIGGKAGSKNLSLVEEYDPRTGLWQQKADMPTPRQGAVAAAVNGKIYVIGGYNGVKHFSIVEEYDPDTDKWSSVSKALMPTARDTAGAAVIDDKIYVIGGFNSQLKYLDCLEVYDPGMDKWEIKTSMQTSRRALGICQINNLIYAIGGFNSDGDVGKVEVYDPLADKWYVKNQMPMNRSYLSAVALKGTVYAIGGTIGVTPVNSVEEFIP